MMGGAILFSLAGLVIAAPRAFLVVMIVAFVALLVVRMELNSHRRARLIADIFARRSANSDTDWAQFLSFSHSMAGGLAAAYSPMVILSNRQTVTAPSNIRSLLVSQWNLTRARKRRGSDNEIRAEVETRLVMKHLEARRKELSRIGVYPLFVSKAPSQEIIRMMHSDRSTRGWGNVVVSHHGPGGRESGPQRMISIVFVSTAARSWPPQLDTILQDVLRIVRGDVLEVTE
jgi:hypothetical protein